MDRRELLKIDRERLGARRRSARTGGLALLGLLWLALQPAPAETWRWTDENGKVHFSDKPPPDTSVQGEEIQVTGPEKIGQGREVEAIQERTRRLLEAEEAQRREQAEQEAEQQREQAEQQRRCQQAKRRLTRLSGPFKYIDENGNRYSVSEEQAEQDRQELRQWIAQNCS